MKIAFIATSVFAGAVLAACGSGATIGSNPPAPGGGSEGGSTATASPAARASTAPGASPVATASAPSSAAPTVSPTTTASSSESAAPSVAATESSATQAGSDQPTSATTSEQTYGLPCSPKFVVSAGGYSSCNMQWLEHINLKGGETIGGHYVASTHTFFLTNWETGVYAFDATVPESPVLDGNLAVPIGTLTTPALISTVENEDTAVNDKTLFLSSTEFNDMVAIDVSNPKNMKVASTLFNAAGHTMNCLDDCRYVYTSTTGRIIDARDPTKPALLSNSWCTATANCPTVQVSQAAGMGTHDLTEVHPGFVALSNNPVQFVDTTDPTNPQKIFALPASVVEANMTPISPSPGHVGHSVIWPRQGADKFFLGQSEGGFVGRCELYPHDGRTLYAYDTTGWQANHNFSLVGAYTLEMGNADTGSAGGVQEVDSNGSPSVVAVGTPQGCSAHWFDVNQHFDNGGLVAMSSFSFGVRLLNVASTGQVQQAGWWVPTGISDTVGVYWITDRIMYALDFETGGLDVIKYTGPLPDGPLQFDASRKSSARARRL